MKTDGENDATVSGDRRVCITGANGFIGSHVADAFAQAGIPVVCQLRPGSSETHLREAGLDHVLLRLPLDKSDAVKALANSFQGLDCVIHIAGRSCDWGSRASFERANVSATKNVLEAARLAGVKRIILAGSISSYGEEDHPNPKDETFPFHPRQLVPLGRFFPSAMNHYRETKARATQSAMEFSVQHGIQLTVLEPVWIFGEREASSGFMEYLDSVRSLPLAPGCPTNLFPVFYVRDLAQAFLRVYQNQPAGVERFIVSSLRKQTMWEFYLALCQEAKIRSPWLVPRLPSMILGTTLELMWTLLGCKHPPPLTRSRVEMFFDSIAFSGKKFHQTFGPFPETPFPLAIHNTVAWYEQDRSRR